ncbi:hypothetical protein [Streptomyces lydicus]|uniref:hypothetical protein n=1 Tax=Streptomyces lydicus TaxID=47763 RepID=UPI0033270FB3
MSGKAYGSDKGAGSGQTYGSGRASGRNGSFDGGAADRQGGTDGRVGPDGAGGPGGSDVGQGGVPGDPSGEAGDDIAVTDSSAAGTERRAGAAPWSGGADRRDSARERARDSARDRDCASDRAQDGWTRLTALVREGEPYDGETYGGEAYARGVRGRAGHERATHDDETHDRDTGAEVAFGGGSSRGGGSGGGHDHGRSHPTGGFGGEDDLRRLLQSRVGDLEPAPDALDQLRRAVPARRQRRRHALVGAAAALLLGGTSIPAMVHVANLADGSPDRAANAASSQRAHDGAEGAHGEGTEQAGPRPPGKDGAKPGAGEPAGKGKSTEKNGAGHGAGAGTPAPDETMDVTSPACSRDQLGQGTGTVRPADSAGRVYGSFRVVNTSGAACSVEGGGTVGVVAQGSTNPDRIHVVDHTSGDEATGLPDPATTPDQLVLKPGEAYEVQFAWIPESGGGTTGCVSPGPSPTPDPTKDPGQSPDAGATTAGDGGGGSGQAGGDEGSAGGGGAASGGIVLSHTPEAGEPAAADAKVSDACAGTVYRTEALAAR